MSTLVFNKVAIRKKLEALPEWKAAAFGALLLERALPNYYLFQSECGVMSGAVLRAASTRLWRALEQGRDDWAHLASPQMCLEVAPDTEDYAGQHVSAALDAAIIASKALHFLESANVEALVEAASLMHDTAYLLASQVLDDAGWSIESGGKVSDSHIVQNEIACQSDDLDFLGELTDNRDAEIGRILSRMLVLKYSGIYA